MSDHDKHGAPKGPTFLSCPFCGRNPDPTDPSTLHPTGTVWRDEAEFRSYHSHSERQEGDGLCWVFSCLTESGGCGAEVHGDSEEQAIAAWNRRCAPSATVPMPVRSTHNTLKEAARLLERWNWTSAASDVRRSMEVIPDLPMIGRVHKAPLMEIAPTPEGLAGMVRNQQDAGADLLRAAHAAAKAEGTPLEEEVPLVRRLHDQRDRCAALLRECLAGVVTDCTDWNRRAREALKDIPDAEQQLRNIAAAMRDDERPGE